MGHHPGRRPGQPHPAARPSPRSCCRWAAGSTATSSGRAPSASTWSSACSRPAPTSICFVISPGKSDILEYYGGDMRRGRPSAYVVQPQGRRPVRRDLPRRAADRGPTSRCWSACPTRSGFPRTASRRCPTTCCRSCCSRSSGRELFDAVVTDERGACRRSRSSSPTPRRTGSGARFRMPGRVLHELRRAVARARTARRVYRHAGQRLARRGGRGASACAPARPTSTSARCTATARRSTCWAGASVPRRRRRPRGPRLTVRARRRGRQAARAT